MYCTWSCKSYNKVVHSCRDPYCFGVLCVHAPSVHIDPCTPGSLTFGYRSNPHSSKFRAAWKIAIQDELHGEGVVANSWVACWRSRLAILQQQGQQQQGQKGQQQGAAIGSSRGSSSSSFPVSRFLLHSIKPGAQLWARYRICKLSEGAQHITWDN